MTEQRIGPDKEVTLHFALKLENGEVVDSTFDKKPATFKVGDGNLLPGFEQALYGLKAGDKRVLPIEPEQGFGQNSGLGLSISRQIVEAHRGSIRAENRAGDPDENGDPIRRGARFVVRLPALASHG